MESENYEKDLFSGRNAAISVYKDFFASPPAKTSANSNALSNTKHSIWSAISLLTETTLPVDIRYHGYQALLWYDTLRDIAGTLPENIGTEVSDLVKEMSFRDFTEEQHKIWQCSDGVKLLKLYTKVAMFFDESGIEGGVEENRQDSLIDYILQLADYLFNIYGSLNIVQIAKRICLKN